MLSVGVAGVGGSSAGAPPPTVTLPIISGCISQWYVSVPCPEKATVKESPGFNVSESNDPSSAVTVCGTAPSLVHVIVSPGSMAISAGAKKLSPMDTDHALFTGTAITPESCCAPAVGTKTSRAITDRAASTVITIIRLTFVTSLPLYRLLSYIRAFSRNGLGQTHKLLPLALSDKLTFPPLWHYTFLRGR